MLDELATRTKQASYDISQTTQIQINFTQIALCETMTTIDNNRYKNQHLHLNHRPNSKRVHSNVL